MATAWEDSLLKRARLAHQRGALDEAEHDYLAVLANAPDHADALHFLGALRFQAGRLEEADQLMARSLECSPSALAFANRASVLETLGRRDSALESLDAALRVSPVHLRVMLQRADLLLKMGRYPHALEGYDRILDRTPALADALYGRGRALQALQRHEEALDSHAHALSALPGNPEILLQQGMVLASLGRVEAALGSLNEALANRPDFIDALYNSAVMLERSGRLVEAVSRCDRVLALDTHHAGALANRGNALAGQERWEEALVSYDAALALEGAHAVAVLCNRARVLRRLKRYEESLYSSEQAIALDATRADGWYARGRALELLHRYPEALNSFERVIELVPDNKLGWFHRGNVLRVMMRNDEAIAAFDRVLEFDPGYVPAHFSKAFVYLLVGDFERGWPEYEYRWRDEYKSSDTRNFPQPLWTGSEALTGKRILLYAEQGFGDTLQFCRFIPLVKARGASVILEVPSGLRSLLAGMEGVDQIIAKGEPLPPFDLYCPLLSLPFAFKTEIATIPSKPAYLRADPLLVEQWRERLGPRARPRIGLAWTGNPKHLDDHNRSIALDSLLPHLGPGIEWISLQKVVREEEMPVLAASGIRDFSAGIGDFSDTAALVETVDCVISVDTSVAHLAGALGRPLRVMLPHMPDWRWLLDRDDSPWYPSARLYRQARPGDWSNVFEQIGTEFPSH